MIAWQKEDCLHPMDRKVIISCEHAGNEVPPAFNHLFDKNQEILNTHRGLDIGALELTQSLGRAMDTQVHIHTISRLLVDLNRSLHNPTAFSEFMQGADAQTPEQVVRDYYLPHREKLEKMIRRSIRNKKAVLHLSVHTFTPELNGQVRNADIAFLYDPQRSSEKAFCWSWRKKLGRKLPDMKYRMNYPYRGTMDGFTSYLRKSLGWRITWVWR